MKVKPKWIFICGCGHTGTTLLSQILTESKDLYCNFLENGQFLLYNHFKSLKLVSSFEEMALNANKKIILEKTPRHVWHLDHIRNSITDHRFILTVREPIPTIESLFKRTGNLEQSIRRYQDDTIQVLRQKNKMDTIIVKYEDLVSQPDVILNTICEFIGIKFEENFLDFYKKGKTWFEDGSINSHIDNRNSQINRPLYKNEDTWVDSSFSKKSDLASWMNEVGNEIRKELGYESKNEFS